jgi:hypothetical protein
MKIDLQADYKIVAAHIAERVRDYPVYINNGPGEDDDPIALITLGFAFDQSGYIAMVFDTRPDAEEDGEWQSYIEENEFEFDSWHDAVDPLHQATAFGGKCDPLTIKRVNGKSATYKKYDDTKIAKDIGMMLWKALVDARDAGVFAMLPLTDNCRMGVEEQDGVFGWPLGNDQGTIDLVKKSG